MYIMKPLTVFVAKLVVRSTPFFGIVNLILNREVSRELLQQDANVETLTAEMEKIIFDKSLRQKQIDDLGLLINELGNSGVTERIAGSLEGMLSD